MDRTFPPGTPIATLTELDYIGNITVPQGARGAVDGPINGDEESVWVTIVDARDPSGYPLSHVVGQRVGMRGKDMKPLVDHWAGAQGSPMGRHHLPRSQRSWMKPNARRTSRSSNRDLQQLVDAAEAQGWVVEKTRSGHLKWIPPDPSMTFVISASSPSDRRALKNIRSRLRQRGLAA